MSATLIALLLALTPAARADEASARGSGAVEIAPELRETLPGGSRAGSARELPSAALDFLPKPTKLEIRVRRAAPEQGSERR